MKEVRFYDGESLKDLSLRVREAYEDVKGPIRIGFQNPGFPFHVLTGGILETGHGSVRWVQAIHGAFEHYGLPKGTLSLDHEYPTHIIYIPED